eukprot:2755467-Amphidinium_carterae.1
MELELVLDTMHTNLVVTGEVDLRRREGISYFALSASSTSMLSCSISSYRPLQRCHRNITGLALLTSQTYSITSSAGDRPLCSAVLFVDALQPTLRA